MRRIIFHWSEKRCGRACVSFIVFAGKPCQVQVPDDKGCKSFTGQEIRCIRSGWVLVEAFKIYAIYSIAASNRIEKRFCV